MRPVFRDFRDTHEAVAEIIAAPTIDRAAAEKLRSERIAAIDAASRKMTTALVEAAEVLTPEQRAKLVEHFKERRSHGRW
jgi:Spy/CpxP family protein refolding chaperone